MTPIVLVGLQLIGIVAIVLAAWFAGKKLLGYPWSALGWGVLAFPLSQVFRFLLIYPVNMLWGAIFDAHTALIATTLTLIATSGLFEEATRWVVMRFWAKRTRAWRDGVGFGLGHGGIEALLTIGSVSINNIVLLLAADQILEAVESQQNPEATEAVNQQIDAVHSITAALVGMSLYERILAITLHVAMSVLVLRAVREHRWVLWLAAVAIHIAFNSIAVGMMQLGPAAMYSAMTVSTLALLWALLKGPLSRKAVETKPAEPPLTA